MTQQHNPTSGIAEKLTIDRETVVSIALSVLIVTSMIGASVTFGTQTAAAESGNASSDGWIRSGDNSTDGNDWNSGTHSNTTPVLDGSTEKHSVWEEKTNLLGTDIREKLWVMKEGGTYHGWISTPSPDSDILYFTSDDGVNWNQGSDNPVINKTSNSQDPSVVKDGDTYYMYVEDGGSRIEIYTSTSPSSGWTLEGSFGTNNAMSPVVVKDGGTWHLFYEEYTTEPYTTRYATSTNGLNFTDQGEILGSDTVPDSVFYKGGEWNLYYHDLSDKSNGRSAPKIATSSTLTGSYTDEGKFVNQETVTTNGPTSPTVVVNESGQWAGHNNGEFRVYGWGDTDISLYRGVNTEEHLELSQTGTVSDGFEDGDLVGWSGNTSDFGVQNSGAYEGTYAANVTSTNADRDVMYHSDSEGNSYSEAWVSTDYYASTAGPALNLDTSTGDYYSLWFNSDDNKLRVDKNSNWGASTTTLNTATGSFSTGTYYKLELYRDGDQVVGKAYDQSGAEVASVSVADTSLSGGYAGLQGFDDTRPAQYDEFLTHDGYSSGSYAGVWHDFGSEASWTSFKGYSAENGGNVTWEYRSSSDGTASTASSWYSSIDSVPSDQYIQARVSLSPSTVSPEVYEYYISSKDGTASGTIQVRVADQNGDPINDATVESYRADEEEIEAQLGDEISSAEEEADRLMDEASDPVPDSYEEYDLAPGDMSPIYDGGEPSGVYPTAHTNADMGLAGYVDAPDLKPRVSYESGESVYLYAWDPSDGDNLGLTEDGVTRQHVGSVDSEATFTITKIDAFGDDINTREVKANNTYSGGTWPLTFEHDYAETKLPDGYYRVSVKGSEAPGYVIKVGDAADLLETQLKDDAGEVSQRAANLQSNLDDGLFTRQKGVTNENGIAQDLTLQNGELAIQAYKGPDPSFFSVDDPSQITASDLRTASEAGYDGAIYIPTRAKRVNTANTGADETVTVELRKVNVGQLSEIEKYEGILDSLVEERLNETTSDLESLYRDRAENLSELEGRHAELKKLVENNEELDSRVEEILGREPTGETETELREEIDAMETAISGLGETLESEEPDSEIEDGEVFAQFPFADSLNEDAVTVMAHYEDGSSEVVDGEYWSVESASVLGGDQVVIDGYPVPSDRAVADLEVRGVSEEGALGSSRDSVRNPLFSGDVPDVEAIDVSTLRPGVGDTVSMSVRSDDSSFNGTSGATVYGPDGNEVAVTKDGDRLRCTPSTPGDHTVRIRYTNEIGHEFVETFRLEVRETATSSPPSLRVTDGIGGKLVLAGDGLESGSVEVVDGTAEITAQAPGGETPSSVNIWAESISEETLDVRVVQGDNEQNVDKHVSLTIRSNADVDEAIVRRSGNALAADGSSKHGSYERRSDTAGNEVTVIETYTDASGVATVEINSDPTLLERILYEVETISIVPAMLGVTSGTPAVLGTATPGELVSSTEVGA